MSTMNVSLPAEMKAWVEKQSKTGRFANSSDYVRDLIRRDQARAAAIVEVQAAVDAALASGPAEAFDAAGFKAEMRRGRNAG